jgi:hypothetical protein
VGEIAGRAVRAVTAFDEELLWINELYLFERSLAPFPRSKDRLSKRPGKGVRRKRGRSASP